MGVLGCAGCVARSGRVGGRELGAGALAASERQWRWGAQDERACRQRPARRAGGKARQARGWAHGAHGVRPAGQHGRAAYAHRLGQLGQLGARAPGLVFSLVFRLSIFPESLKEHCSL